MPVERLPKHRFTIPVHNLTSQPLVISVPLVAAQKRSINIGPKGVADVDRDLLIMGRELFQAYKKLGLIYYEDNVQIPYDEQEPKPLSNIIYVNETPGPGEYNSIKAAVDAITDASINKPYVVNVFPGVYIEDTIQMKPYVWVSGSGQGSTRILSSNPNQHLFMGCDSSGIEFCFLSGATGIGYASVYRNDAGSAKNAFWVTHCQFGNNDHHVLVESDGDPAAIFVDACVIGGDYSFRKGFVARALAGQEARVLVCNTTTIGMSAPYAEDVFIAEGAGSNIIVNSCQIRNGIPQNGNCFRCNDGGRVRVIGTLVRGFIKGIHIENIGVAPSISCDGISFEDCIEDLVVEHPGATGHVGTPSDRTKVNINPSSLVYIPNKDLKVLDVFKTGGDFTSVKDAMDFITDNSSASRYIVRVGPGIFVEDTIQMKPYVSLVGLDATTSIIQVDDPNKFLIESAPFSNIVTLTLRGGTGVSGGTIRGVNHNPPGIMVVTNVIFGSAYTVFKLDATLFCQVSAVNCLGEGFVDFNKFFVVDGVGMNVLAVILFNLQIGPGVIASHILDISGPTNQVYITNYASVVLPGGFVDTLIEAKNGCSVGITDIGAIGYNKGLEVPNIGAAPLLRVSSFGAIDTTTSAVNIQHPGATGYINGAFRHDHMYIDDAADIGVFHSDPTSGSSVGVGILGDILQGDIRSRVINFSKIVREGTVLGLVDGGEISQGVNPLDIDVAAGTGFIEGGVGIIKEPTWTNTTLSVPINSDVYVTADEDGIIQLESSYPSFTQRIILGRVVTNATEILLIETSLSSMHHHGNHVEQYLREALGPVFSFGGIVTENGVTPRSLDVTAGKYFFGTEDFNPVGGVGITYDSFYQDGIGGSVRIAGQTQVDNTQWDNGTGTLASLTAGYFAKHLVLMVGDGANEKYFKVYAQSQHSLLLNAQQADLPSIPSFLRDAVVRIASIIVQQGASNIIEVRDERPRIGFTAAAASGAADHGSLIGLLDNDHPQYLLRNGTNVMTGALNMNSNNITNAGTINGVTITAHASRHLPTGADPLTTAAPIASLSATTTNDVGTANSLSRSDHSHDILTGTPSTVTPDQVNAEGSSSNLARADHIHNIPTDAPDTSLSPSSTNAEGAATSFARSNHTHAISTAVAIDITTILPDDAAAAGTANNFARGDHKHAISTAVAVGINANSVNAEGASSSFSRADHTHAISTGAPLSQAPDQANSAGTSTNLARADHIHNIPTDAPDTSLSPSSTNAEGIGSSFARNNHTHAISTATSISISTILPDAVANAGTADNFARGDHTHAISTDTATGLNANSANAEGTGTAFARNDHTHAISTGAASTITVDQANSAGTSANVARADHIHNIPTAVAVGLSAASTNTQGASSSFARADHTHAISSAIAGEISTITPDATAAAGTANSFARGDHVHAIAAAAASTISAATTNTEGVSTSFSRADHTHAISTGAASTQTPDQANSAGTSANLARADHVHNIPTGTPTTVGAANAQGTAATFARADHVHRLPYQVRSDRKTGGSQSVGSTVGVFSNISFQTNDLNAGDTGSNYITKPNDTDFTIANPGLYRAGYNMKTDSGGNNNGIEADATLDGVSIPQSSDYGETRTSGAESVALKTTFVFQTTTSNQVLRFRAAPREAATSSIENSSIAWVELIRLT